MINIKTRAEDIEKGDIFIAIKGKKFDGHDFVREAKNRGAKCAIVERYTNSGIPELLVDDTNKWLSKYLEDTYGKVIEELNIIGITGTNGKTTSSYLTYQMLNNLGSKTAYIGTIGFYVPEKEVRELNNTTPSIRDLYELLLEAKEAGCKNVVMEVSSHALDQGRIEGLKFRCGAFTNLSQDHLDYHKTMGEYFKAKKKILDYIDGTLVVNTDDIYGRILAGLKSNVLAVGYFARDFKVLEMAMEDKGTAIKFSKNCQIYEVQTNLRGKFNVYNYLTAMALVYALGYSIDDVIAVSDELRAPKGRCEEFKVGEGTAIVDYAHTPDAVLKIINEFKNEKGRVITVIGCGGDRDKGKRRIMGGIATEFSDYVIFTSDNPRSENPEEIINDMIRWVSSDNYEVILDRKEAIKKALGMIRENDTVLVLGKGHENYQIIGEEKKFFDDALEIQSYAQEDKLSLDRKK